MQCNVCIYWHAILAEINSVIKTCREEDNFPEDVAQQIYGILHQRHKELFNKDGNGRISTVKDLFYAGLYLDPGKHYQSQHSSYLWLWKSHLTFEYCISAVYLQSDADIFKTDAVPEAQTVDYTNICHPPIFQAVAKFLYQTAIDEIGTGEQVAFTRWQGHALEFDEQFSGEIHQYAQQQYPYNDAI